MTDLDHVDPNLVVVLDALLAERHLGRAGERLGMPGPAVGSALARLRRQFDDPLLVRRGRCFELTDRARHLQPVIARAMAEIRSTLAVMPGFDPALTRRTFCISGSDYALGELAGPLQALVREHAPGARVGFDSLPMDGKVSPTDLLLRDVLIAGTGRGVPGKHRPLFLDRFVCLAAADHPRLVDGRLGLDDLGQVRHVRSTFGAGATTHADDMLVSAGITPDVAVVVEGFLPVPFMIAGTELVGFVPERIADRYAAGLGLRVVATPIAPMTLVEAAYWHPSRTSDPALVWLLDMLWRASTIVEFGSLDVV